MALFDRENQLIQILESLARTGNISQTASELFLTQPTVSKIIRTQEKEFGCEFIDRTAHPLKLTYAGEYYLTKIKGLAQAYQTMSNNLQAYATDLQGQLSIGINPSLAQVILPRILPRFHRHYPQIEVQLLERDSQTLQQLVHNGDLDIYVGVTPAYNRALAYRHLYNDGGMLVLPKALAPAKLPAAPLIDAAALLNGVDFIAETPDSDYQHSVAAYLTKYNITPNQILQTPNLTTACVLATAGLGATIVPNSMPKAYLKDHAVVCLPLDASVFQTEVQIAYNQERQLNEPLQTFIEMAITAFS